MLQIPGAIAKPESQVPMARYGIARNQLMDNKVALADVDRIYKSLFVYSVGFYDMLKTSLGQSNRKFEQVAKVWKVFAILQEFCCKANYEKVVQALDSKCLATLDSMEIHLLEEQ